MLTDCNKQSHTSYAFLQKHAFLVTETSYSAILSKNKVVEGYGTQNIYETFFFSCFLSFFLQWKGVSQRQASSSVIRFEALAIGLQRLSALLSKTLDNDRRQADSLKIGTYVPYRVDSETRKVFVMCIRYLSTEEIWKMTEKEKDI